MSIGNVFSLLASPDDLASRTLRPLENFGAISADGVAIEGKDDWLFLYGGTNGYCDAYHLPEQTANSEVAGWIESLSQYQKLCAKYNATFLPVIIPNKATILNGQYPKDLRGGITPILGLLLNRFSSILCPVRKLKSRHHAEAIFRRNDSHLTEYGNLLFVKEILQGLAINVDGMVLPGELNHINNNGDLGQKFDPPITEKVARINFQSSLSFEMVEIAPPIGAHTGLAYETTCASAPIQQRLLIFGNSFFDRPNGWSMAPYFCRLFANVRFHWESGVYEDHISEYGPDYVMFQTCERFLGAQPRKIPFSDIRNRFATPESISQLTENNRRVNMSTNPANPISYFSQRVTQDAWIHLPLWKRALELFDSEVSEDLSNAPPLLKNVPLAVFGTTLLNPEKHYNRAHKYLPVMAPESVQRGWTGATGAALLETSVAFVNQQLALFAANGIKINSDTRILDFGIGWGRIGRLWLKYLPPSQLYGCDAWDKSLDVARQCRLKNTIVKSDSLLRTLPYPEKHFDHIYAMSIFTHLDQIAFNACLEGIGKMLKPNGFAIITVRPSLFWERLRSDLPDHVALSKTSGFVFRHQSHDPNFGDSTVDLPWLYEISKKCGMVMDGIEWSPADAMQIIIHLRKMD